MIAKKTYATLKLRERKLLQANTPIRQLCFSIGAVYGTCGKRTAGLAIDSRLRTRCQ